MGKLFQVLLTFFIEDGGAEKFFKHLFESEIKKFGSAYNPKALLEGAFKEIPVSQLYQKFNSLNSKVKKDLFDRFNAFNKGKESEQEKVEFVLFDENEKVSLSSSFLEYGIFTYQGKDIYKGHLILAMSGKEFDFGEVRTAIWASMVQATGSNGTGAGSVLWNTIWWTRRTKSKATGGVAGTVENLIKRKRQIYAQIARNTKTLHTAKSAQMAERAQQVKQAMFSRRARVARKA